MKDSKVKFYIGKLVLNKCGNIYYCEEKVEICFWLVVIKNEKKDKEFWFLINEFEFLVKEIVDYYRKCWDIEVFFRFLK